MKGVLCGTCCLTLLVKQEECMLRRGSDRLYVTDGLQSPLGGRKWAINCPVRSS